MTYAERIRSKLVERFAPVVLEIVDESHRHAGHAGHGGVSSDGETHFHVTVVSEAFSGLSRVERQRQIYQVLADELKERVHALALNTKTPAEVNGTATP